MAGCADREARIAEGRADPELESLGGFAVSTAGVAEPLEWRLEAAFSGLYRARVP
jgi:hypothetical protein